MRERELESGFTTRQKAPSDVTAMAELDRLMVVWAANLGGRGDTRLHRKQASRNSNISHFTGQAFILEPGRLALPALSVVKSHFSPLTVTAHLLPLGPSPAASAVL